MWLKHYPYELYPRTALRLRLNGTSARTFQLSYSPQCWPQSWTLSAHPHRSARRVHTTGERAGEGASTLCRELGPPCTPTRVSQGWGRALLFHEQACLFSRHPTKTSLLANAAMGDLLTGIGVQPELKGQIGRSCSAATHKAPAEVNGSHGQGTAQGIICVGARLPHFQSKYLQFYKRGIFCRKKKQTRGTWKLRSSRNNNWRGFSYISFSVL